MSRLCHVNCRWTKRQDPHTGFVCFGARDYIPQLGRWLTPDPAGFSDGPNLYAYVHNSPLTHFDPYGLAEAETKNSKGFMWHCTMFYNYQMASLSLIPFNASQASMKRGITHGRVDFFHEQVTPFEEAGFYLRRQLMSKEKRGAAYDSHQQFLSAQYAAVDSTVHKLIGGDQNDESYRYARSLSRAQMEVGSIGLAAYGIGRWLLARGVRLYEAAQTGRLTFRQLFKPAALASKGVKVENGVAKAAARRGRQVNFLDPYQEAVGSHTSFRRDPITGRIDNYLTYERNHKANRWAQKLRFRGTGTPHHPLDPPIIYEREIGKGPSSPLSNIRKPRLEELPYGY